MGFGTGVAAAGGKVVASGVATLAPLQPLPSLPEAPDDEVAGEDDDEIEIEKHEAEVESSEMPTDVRALTHIKTKCFAMPFGNRGTFCFGTRSTICFTMPFWNRETFCFGTRSTVCFAMPFVINASI